MQLSKQLLIIGAVSSTILSSCTSIDNPKSPNSASHESSSYSRDFLGEFNKIPLEYRETEQFNICIKSNLGFCYHESVIEKAQNAKNTIVCDELQNENAKQRCIESVSYYNAVESGDTSKCSEITGNMKINCEYSIIAERAREEENIDVCKEIGTGMSGSGSLDQNMTEAYEQSRIDCSDYVINVLAFQNVDINLCKEIINSDSREQCTLQLEGMQNVSGEDNINQTGSIVENSSTGSTSISQEESQ